MTDAIPQEPLTDAEVDAFLREPVPFDAALDKRIAERFRAKWIEATAQANHITPQCNHAADVKCSRCCDCGECRLIRLSDASAAFDEEFPGWIPSDDSAEIFMLREALCDVFDILAKPQKAFRGSPTSGLIRTTLSIARVVRAELGSRTQGFIERYNISDRDLEELASLRPPIQSESKVEAQKTPEAGSGDYDV